MRTKQNPVCVVSPEEINDICQRIQDVSNSPLALTKPPDEWLTYTIEEKIAWLKSLKNPDADDTSLLKQYERAARLSEKDRSGKKFTTAGKDNVTKINEIENNGDCIFCGTKLTDPPQNKRGSKVKKTDRQIDHQKSRNNGGSGTPDNGGAACAGCNNSKKDNNARNDGKSRWW